MNGAVSRPGDSRSRSDRRRRGRKPRTSTLTSPALRRIASLARGAWIVTELDLRSASRRRTTWVVTGAWIALVYGLLVLALAGTGGGSAEDGAGSLVHSLVATSALAVGLAAVPALGAGTLTRTRDTGLLDMLRVTRLDARAISWGIYLGTLVRVLGLVLLAVPALLTGFALRGTDISGVAGALTVLGVTFAAVAAVAQAASAVWARRTASLIAAYTATGLLVLGPAVAYAVALPLTSETVTTQVTVLAGTHGTQRSPDGPPCTTITEDRERTRPDRIWWLLAPEPFVALADAAPGRIGGAVEFEPLSAARDGLRLARVAPADPGEEVVDECPVSEREPETQAGATGEGAEAAAEDATRAVIEAVPPTWPLGLAALAATGAAAIGLSTRRLRAPGTPARGEHLADSVAGGM